MNKEQPIYRIKVEVIGTEDENHKIDETFSGGGIDCNGFAIMCDKKDSCSAHLHHISIIDLASIIARSGDLLSASMIAKAMRDSRTYIREKNNPLADFLKAMSE